MKAKDISKKQRILALDVRARRLGFATFESQSHLLEFGLKRFTGTSGAMIRLTRLVRTVRPHVLVFRKMQPSSPRNTRGTRTILRLLWLLARRSSIDVSMIREKQVRQRFNEQGARTKYQIALFLVGMFPELEWRLPPARKPWKSEHRNMSIYDAVALGVAYLASIREQ